MKNHIPRASLLALLAAASISFTHAQTNGTWITTSPDGNTGNWSDSTKWVGGNIANGGGNATFGPYDNARTVTVDGTAYVINKLTIQPRTSGFVGRDFTLNTSGGGSLSIGAGGIDIGNSGVVTINAPIEVTANQTWNALDNPAGSATFNGTISGVGKITRSSAVAGGSTFRFNGANTFSGGYEQLAGNSPTTILGSSSTVTSGSLASGPLGTGTVTLNGGVLRSNDGTARTLHNNIVIAGPVTFGGSGATGALTFSDAGLTTPSTFTLSSATDGAVNVVRTANTALTIDQVIAESGGVGQSVLFSSMSGTPTVTIGRTKTATGNLLTGGVNLVLANGAANSGSILAVNGAVTATGPNKFSSGALITDGASLVATDASNYSDVAGGRATVYNNGRVSFATDQTQATIASLLTADSQVRVGLGSGSGSATVTENYDQSALGNGRAGLVSASTGTITYTGTLTAGSDSTYRVGGGLGTLALGSALTGNNALRVEGGGIVTSTVNHTYTGSTTISGPSGYTGSSALTSGLLTLSGANGALSGTSSVTLNSGAILNLEVGGTGNNRINNSASVTLNSGYMLFNNAASNAAFSETMGDFVVNAGANQINFRTAPAASTIRTVQFGNITRNNNAVLMVRGDSLGGTATNRNEIKFTNTPTLIGGGGAAGSSNQSIVPWMRGAFDGAIGSNPGRFVTYDANGLRTLSPVTEMVQANNNTTARIDQAIATAGGGTDLNVRSLPSTTGGATLVNTASSTVTLNSLMFSNAGATAANTYSLNSSTINITSGALHIQNEADQNLTLGSGTFAFGAAEAIITTNARGFLSTLSTTLTGSGGVSIYNLNGGGISLGSTTNNIIGTFTFGGNGFVAVDNDTRFGNASNSVVHGGGELRFFAGLTTSRALNLLGNVGDNTFGNNNNAGQTAAWNGDISGDGRLRLINNNGANGNNGFSLGGNNTYSGGTQIEGINVTASSNSALGTGTVTLQGANNNAATLNVTAAAGTLGGLRGTDGTVNINPTASSATLTVGSNNDNTVFNGVITQGSGKTGSLDKVGTGTLVLGGSNTYIGTTTISAGTLDIQGGIASDLAIAGGKLELGGAGIKNLTLATDKNFTLTSGTWNIDIFSGTIFDSITGSGTAAFNISGGVFDFNGSTIALGVTQYQLFSGFDSGTSSASGFTWNYVNPMDPGFTITNVTLSNTGLLEITAVPEPSTWALITLGLIAMVLFRRYRRVA